MSSRYRLSTLEGEVAHSAVFGLRKLVEGLFAGGVRPCRQDFGAMAEARGGSTTVGYKAFKAIKKVMCDHITLAAFDKAAAADGSCPLE